MTISSGLCRLRILGSYLSPITKVEQSGWGRSILITIKGSIRDLTELLACDEALAAAILDRLLNRSNLLEIKGRS
ncbi:hypothetical protein LNKW23_47290 [Paralimibaculum aggregatum]|uniref:IstB-like ATP-binding domain-containing protein n=1 Tax=Paralimibaculum aggregatum TaxID=3036245 RepID=A0ABQ6LTW7_9RHOB|nr:ATP-binding protein [Limibaculum sp. NKW23]GMG85507.1 hypothetical protein LNKW23_47290 [Limibaculum sp. NKW23]